MNTYGGRDYRQWSRYPWGVDEDRCYKTCDQDNSCAYSMDQVDTSATSNNHFGNVDTDDDAWLEQAEKLQRGTPSDKIDTDLSAPEDLEDNEVTSITSPRASSDATDNTVPKTTSPLVTWNVVHHSRPQTPTPDTVTSSLHTMRIQDAPMDDPIDRQSNTSSEATSSISAHIVKAYEEEPSMDNMMEWVQWRAPQLAVPPWMQEELRKCEDVDNVTQTVRAITEWLDNIQIVRGSDSWPTFKTPAALFPDIYKESTLLKADPKLRPGDQSVLFLCQALQSMVELSALEDETTPNWRYGHLSQTACYVL